MRFVFRRFEGLIPKATVRLSDVNGPRGGIDKRCQVEIRSDVAGTVVVAAVARDWRTALDMALSRAARFLTRQWRRGSDSRRLRQRAIPQSNGEPQLKGTTPSMTPTAPDPTRNERRPEFVDSDHRHDRYRNTSRRKSWLSDIFD